MGSEHRLWDSGPNQLEPMRRLCLAGLVFVAPRGASGHEEAQAALRGRELTATSWEVGSHHTCSGMETYWDSCPNLPPCAACTPQNCVFNEWAPWTDGKEDCIGLCRRTRSIVQHSNECGKPCSSTTEETKSCWNPSCTPQLRDCTLGHWRSWSDCEGDATKQTTRSRMVTQHAKDGGSGCGVSLVESKPCGARSDIACKYAEWDTWTGCSASCGVGHRTRARSVDTRAIGVGKACAGALSEETQCSSATPCANVAAAMSLWGQWSGCSKLSDSQESRQRIISATAQGIGQAVTGPLQEVRPCSTQDCKISTWGAWTTCDQICGGGQKMRMRTIESPQKNGGKCAGGSMSEITPCASNTCFTEGAGSCKLSVWNEWSACSSSCGSGSQARGRAVLQPALPGFEGCGNNLQQAPLQETRVCTTGKCTKIDCKWGEWQPFEDCPVSCGGGTQRRFREIVTTPMNDGLGCAPLSKAEMRPCNNQTCEACVDGTWGVWDDWSICSATCGSAYRSRHREEASAPNLCGKPATGSTSEHQICPEIALGLAECPSSDCTMSIWDTWSQCSSSCYGVRNRKRTFLTPASGDIGKACDGTLEEIGPCFSGTPENRAMRCRGERKSEDCAFSAWSTWSGCTHSGDVKCGAGQSNRHRSILSPAINAGAACKGGLSATKDCISVCAPIGCKDCTFGQWSSWSLCNTGAWPHRDGQSTRSRKLLQMANHCGTPCPVDGGERETKSCVVKASVPLTLCSWSPWTAFGACPSQCNKSRTRARSYSRSLLPSSLSGDASSVKLAELLSSTFSGNCTMAIQEDRTHACSPCSPPVCIAHDLIMDEFTEWKANGVICSRERKQKQAKNKCGSYVGLGSVGEAKSCDPKSAWTACHLSSWGAWNLTCEKMTDQPFRQRGLSANFPDKCLGFTEDPSLGGILKETKSCADLLRPKRNCAVADWSAWKPCSTPQPCSGVQTRSRNITAAQSLGDACDNSIEQAEECGQCLHNQSCKLTAWSPPITKCKNYTSDNIFNCHRVSTRGFANTAGWVEKPCVGALEEYYRASPLPQACVLPAWTEWTFCSKSCHGGSSARSRVVVQKAAPGGKACPDGARYEVRACNDETPCLADTESDVAASNCTATTWGTWSPCSATCGFGMESRSREINGIRRKYGFAWTQGCTGALNETRKCGGSPCNNFFQCITNEWSAWSACSLPCDGGLKNRLRNISQFPLGGGKPCEAGSIGEEVAPCRTQRCPSKCIKINAVWGEWTSSGACSSTCSGGFRSRKRVLVQNASECGAPASGLAEDAMPCNTLVPCVQNVSCSFHNWSAWSQCISESKDPCSGLQKRSRKYTPKTGSGKMCSGPLDEAVDCVPPSAAAKCNLPPPVDCAMGSWSQWGNCSRGCGGGQKERSRGVTGTPQGKPCAGELQQVASCNEQNCEGTTDCTYSPWAAWGACQSCGGQRSRLRHIVSYPQNGGVACADEDLEETDKCPRDCNTLFCSWGDWRSWGECSTKCGTGKRSRTRILGLVAAPTANTRLWDESVMDDGNLEDRVQELYRKTQSYESGRRGELVLAFSMGIFVLLAFIAFSGTARQATCGRTSSRVINTLPMLAEPHEIAGVSERDVAGPVLQSGVDLLSRGGASYAYRGIP